MSQGAKIIGKFISTNILWYLILSFIHFNLNILEWWAITNVFGRVLLTLLEVSIIFSSIKMVDDDFRE